VLAAFCWTKSLLCNVAAFTGMLLYPESTLQLCSSRRFCEVFKDLFRFPVNRPDDVVFRPDAHQCLETSNSSRLHPSGRSSEFEKIPVFQHICPDDVVIPSGHHSGFDKNMHTKFNRLDVSLHGPDDQASYMEIACTSSTVRTLAFKVRTLQALLW
jgi:hypothetical protein